MYQMRIEQTRLKMKENGFDAILVSSTEDLRYFTGRTFHPGERFIGLMILPEKLVLILNKLFPITSIEGVTTIFYDDIDNPLNLVSSMVSKGQTIGVDKNLKSHFLLKLMKMRIDLKYENGSTVVDRVRMIKTASEIELMIKASEINDQVMADVSTYLKTNHKITEKMLSDYIIETNQKYGVMTQSFPSIVCFGENGALPHHETGETSLERQNAIIVDTGGVYEGYCSDMTRSFYFGEPDAEYINVYETVRKAQENAIKTVKPGVSLKEVDAAARNIINEAGYGEFFTHRTGHGIGSEVHEFPDVSAISDVVCREGMIFSIEPGVYLPGKFGVRIEDLVLVTATGVRVLNKFTKLLTKFSE